MDKRKIFIHIPKNAGMTIRRSPYLKDKILLNHENRLVDSKYVNGLLKKMYQIGDHHGFEHARWRDLQHDYRNSHRAFAIIRNPWDRVKSRYNFISSLIIEGKQPKDYADVSSFEAFLEERFKWGNEPFMWHRAVRGWYPAWDHVSDENGEKCKADIIRFGHLNEEIMKYFKLKEMSRARNVTTFSGVKYTNKTIQIVADWYQKDIDYWGFDFDTEAQKNYYFEKSC
jgi:hypothetical protein